MEVLTGPLSRLYTESLQCRPRVRGERTPSKKTGMFCAGVERDEHRGGGGVPA